MITGKDKKRQGQFVVRKGAHKISKMDNIHPAEGRRGA
jgi:hypothetical protein